MITNPSTSFVNTQRLCVLVPLWQMSKLFNRVNFQQLNTAFQYLLTKLDRFCCISFLRGINCGGSVSAKNNIPALYSCIKAFILVSHMDNPTDSPKCSEISIIGNSYLQLCANSMTSLSIVYRAITVWYLYCHNTGKF